MKSSLIAILALAFTFLFVGCETTEQSSATSSSQAPALGSTTTASEDEWDDFDDEIEEESVSDPIEGFNRAMFSFNDSVYGYVFRPVSEVYSEITPPGMRDGISNFFDNARYPIRVVNQVLQGKFEEGAKETGMFLVNTTYGVLGIYDRADEFPNLDVPAEDLGQTLGVWGFGNGPYVVLPILGPLTVRDGVGRVGDYFLDPFSYLGEWQWEADWSAKGIETVNALPQRVGVYDAVTRDALDKYSALKDAYIQLRKKQVSE